MRHAAGWLAVTALLLAGIAFAQESVTEKVAAPADREPQLILPLGPLTPGGGDPIWEKANLGANYDGNEEMIQAGKQLYAAMNCVGCHSHGGGGMGPALMDDTWIYGSSIEHIVSTIREGRPNGMPSYRGRLPDEQIWQIAAYVRSFSRHR